MIKLQDLLPTHTHKKLDKILAIRNYQEFVKSLGKLSKDQHILNFIKNWKYTFKDKELTSSKKFIPVCKLIPTQKEIDLEKTLSQVLTEPEDLHYCCSQKNQTIGIPIVTFNGEYIIDGHHRWSKLLSVNPQACIECIDIEGDIDAKSMLRLMQLVIMGETGKVEIKDVKGKNMLNVADTTISRYITNTITDDCIKVFSQNYSCKTKESIVKRMLKNIRKMKSPIRGAVNRNLMPQLGDTPQAMTNVIGSKSDFQPVKKINENYADDQQSRELVTFLNDDLDLSIDSVRFGNHKYTCIVYTGDLENCYKVYNRIYEKMRELYDIVRYNCYGKPHYLKITSSDKKSVVKIDAFSKSPNQIIGTTIF